MADLILTLEVRERTGKGGAREARRNDMVPGVLYGGGKDPVAISLKKNEVIKALNSGTFLAHMIEVDHKGEKQSVIAQDVQFHPVTDMPEHVDLYRVDKKQIISVEVPVHFVGILAPSTQTIVSVPPKLYFTAGVVWVQVNELCRLVVLSVTHDTNRISRENPFLLKQRKVQTLSLETVADGGTCSYRL